MNRFSQQRKMVVDGQLTEVRSVQTKVEKDINFLENRIQLMQKQKTPNAQALATYQNMLQSRQSVLCWLNSGA
jgi:chaperonin cofactor prefoldin